MNSKNLKINILNNGSRDDVVTRVMQESDSPVVIYGNGSISRYTQKKLQQNGLSQSYCVLDDRFYSGQEGCISIEECNNRFGKYIVLLGFFEAFFMDKNLLNEKFINAEGIYYYSETYGYETLDCDFVNKNIAQFEYVFNRLEDELSRHSLEAYLNSKMNRDASFLFPHVVLPSYVPRIRVATNDYDDKFMNFSKDEIFVNCGAFVGDTINSMVIDSSIKFKKIYAVEPDKSNMEKLNQFLIDSELNEIVQIVGCGLSDEPGTAFFSSDGNMKSAISEYGKSEIAIETIDNIVQEDKITFINMDIEGAELNALKGAENTISNLKPKLAISAYHKRDDIFLIQKLLETMNPEYKFYFRLHKPLAIDAVLYAI